MEEKNEKVVTKKKKIVTNENKKESLKKTTISKKTNFKNSEVIFLILITCIVSIIMGWTLCYKLNLKANKITDDKALEQFIETYNTINENYYDELDKDKLIKGAISGMLKETGDSYSTVIDESDKSNFDARLQGRYTGVGIEITNNDKKEIVIVGVFKNSSAWEQDVRIGDIILSINDVDLSGQDISTLVNYINENNQQYKIKIKRDNEQLEKTLVRKTVIIDSVNSKIYEKNNKKIGYIKIDIFSGEAANQFKSELTDLENKKIDSLIIDVRDNDGGYLTTASTIVSSFLDKKHVIYQMSQKNENTKYYSTGDKTKTYPIIILQNQDSASASELLSIALKEEYKATVVGTNSFGKGTVQELTTLPNGLEYKYTSKKWLSPSGKWINEIGVIPDVKVEQTIEYYKNPTEENDNQLQKVLSLLAD